MLVYFSIISLLRMTLVITGMAGYVIEMLLLVAWGRKDSKSAELFPELRAMKYHQQQAFVNGTTNGQNCKRTR